MSLLLLGGCTAPQLQLTTGTRNLPVEESFVLPAPGTVAALALIEKRYTNAIQQDLFLSTSGTTPGQNYIRTQFYGTKTDVPFRDNSLGYKAITTARVSEEMRRELPGIRMVRSPYYVQNNYGAFGYAFGHSGASDLCLYAWQQIRSPAGTVSLIANYGAIQVRMRICQTGATEQSLLALMYSYTINATVGTSGWNPYGEPQGAPTTLGRTGSPIYPKAPDALAITPVVGAAPVSRPPAAAPVTRRSVAERPQPVAAPIAPTVIVPSPISRAPNSPAPSGQAPTGRVPGTPSRTTIIPSPTCALNDQGEKPFGCE